jgi:hypothetical protein
VQLQLRSLTNLLLKTLLKGREKIPAFLFTFSQNYIMESLLSKILSALFSLKTGGVTDLIKITGAQVGVSGAAYGTGDVIGTTSPIKIEPVRGVYGTGVLHSIIVQDLSNQSGAIDLVIFDSNPTATTFTDNGALDIADADLPKVIGVVSVTSTDYASFADSSVATITNLGLLIKSLATTPNLWICPVSRDTKTYAANELSLVIGVLQD